MENQDIVKAIHDLELSIMERIHAHSTVLEVNNQRIKDLSEKVTNQHIALFGSHLGGRTGLLQRMDDLERYEKERQWTLRTVSTAFLGLVCKFLWDMFTV